MWLESWLPSVCVREKGKASEHEHMPGARASVGGPGSCLVQTPILRCRQTAPQRDAEGKKAGVFLGEEECCRDVICTFQKNVLNY